MRDMKESGMEWIGAIPASWKIMTIGSLFNVRNEKVNDTDYPPLSVTKHGVVPQLETVAKSDANDNRKMVLANDFVINSRSDRKQSCGVATFDGSVSLINTVLYLKKDAPVIPEYLNYLLKNDGFAEEFYRWGHGIVADLWTTRWQEMKSIPIPIPPIEEQERFLAGIAAPLDKILRLKANVLWQIEKLKAYKQSVITEAVTKGLDSTTLMKNSGIDWLGEIPEHWAMRKANTLSERIVVGVVIRPSEYFDASGTIPFLRGMNVKDYQINTDDLVYITEESNQALNKSIVHAGDILIVRDGNIGASCIVPPELDGSNVVSMIIFTANSECAASYICYCLNSRVGKNQFELTKIGSALTHTSVSAVSRLFFPLPPISEQNRITAYLDDKCRNIDRLIAIKQAKIEKLEQYKRSLIYEYVTGKREVS